MKLIYLNQLRACQTQTSTPLKPERKFHSYISLDSKLVSIEWSIKQHSSRESWYNLIPEFWMLIDY